MAWNSHLPPKKKAALLIMFSGGFLEMSFGILSCVSILTVCPFPVPPIPLKPPFAHVN
jgi:hypothetical protein